MLGKTRSELVNRRFALYISDDSKPIFNSFRETIIIRKVKESCEVEILNNSSSPKHLHLSGVITKNDDQIFVMALDITKSKEAKEILENSHLLLKSSLESQNDTILLSIDQNYRYLYFNKAHLEVMKYAYDKDIKVGMNILECMTNNDDRQVAKENYDRALQGESHSNIRVYGSTKLAYYESFFNPIVNDTNKIVGATALARNITDRKKAEEELIFLKKAIESTIDAIGISDAEGHHIYQNKAFSDLFGYTTAEELEAVGGGKAVIKDPEVAIELYEHIMSGNSYSGEWDMVKKNGQIFPVSQSADAIKDSYGNIIGLIGIIEDITERKKAEEALRESVDRYKLITQNTLDIVFMINKTGKQLFFNDSVEKILGYKKEELIGKSFTRFVPKSELPKYLFQLKNVFLNKEIQNFISKVYHKNGSLVEVEINGKLVKHDGKLVALGTIRDISALRKDELIIKEKNKELSKINAEKNKFFSIIAHDLKGPIGNMAGLSEYLVKYIKEKNHDKIERIANAMQQSSNRTMDLLSNLMSWAQSQSGRMDYNPEYFEIDPLVQEAKQLLIGIAEQKSIIINNAVKTNNKVFADKAMISAVLRNLISNAIKFTNTGGKITILAENKENILTMSINDNGVGISEYHINKLFQIAESESTSGTENEKGTGLGLILCKEFIEKNNGKIWVKSKVGVGSSFYFSLPTTNEASD